MKYYSAARRKESLSLPATWMGLDDRILGKSQMSGSPAQSHLHKEFKTKERRVGLGGWGRWGDGGQTHEFSVTAGVRPRELQDPMAGAQLLALLYTGELVGE